jgi:hypothetical protein
MAHILIKPVIAYLIHHPQQDKDGTSQAGRQPQDIQDRKQAIADEIAKSGLEIVFEHKQEVWILLRQNYTGTITPS